MSKSYVLGLGFDRKKWAEGADPMNGEARSTWDLCKDGTSDSRGRFYNGDKIAVPCGQNSPIAFSICFN